MKFGKMYFLLSSLSLVVFIFSANETALAGTTVKYLDSSFSDEPAGSSSASAFLGSDDLDNTSDQQMMKVMDIVQTSSDSESCLRSCRAVASELICNLNCNKQFPLNKSDSAVEGSVNVCSEQSRLSSECMNNNASAISACDANNDSQMNGVSKMASDLSLAFGQQSASSIQTACSGVGQISMAANAAIVGFRLRCSNAINSCKNSCGKLLDYLKTNPGCDTFGTAKNTAQSYISACSGLDAKVNEANQAMMNVAQTLNSASQCAALVSDGSIPDLCKTNPSAPGCAASAIKDCSNPEMASNKVCICTNNPSDPSCASNIQATSSGAGYTKTDPSSRLTSKQTLTGNEDVLGTDAISQGKAGSTDYSSSAVSGKQGAGAGISGGGGSSGGGTSRGSSQGSDKDGGHSVNAGFYGGSGGGAGFSSSSYQDSGGGRVYSNGGSQVGKSDSPNLRHFLPGGANDPRSRGVAGSSGPDGITGPNSNIWQKVNNRYRVVHDSLLP